MTMLYPFLPPVRLLPALIFAAALAAATNAARAAGPTTPISIPDAPYRAPYVPTQDDEILQQVPASSDPAVHKMAILRAALNFSPENPRTADQLAWAYLGFGRRLGDAHYAGYAEAVIAPWMASASPPDTALVLQATILQVRHEFDPARKLLEQALARAPQNVQAWLTLATLDTVQGRYAEAERACGHIGRTAGLAARVGCAANLREYQGQARQSIALLEQANVDAPGQSPDSGAWVQGLLAESFERLGDWTSAEAHYRRALTFASDDNFLLVAYADFLLDRHRPREVLALLADHTQSDTAFLRLALAQAALKSPDAPRYTWIMAARFEALRQRGSYYFGREQARFALQLQHDPQAALMLAEQNWQVQHEPWDARVLLEAAQAANRPDAASPVLAFLRQSRLEDPIIEPLARQLQALIDAKTVAR
jgi:Tfp pilus assembly protein PilF